MSEGMKRLGEGCSQVSASSLGQPVGLEHHLHDHFGVRETGKSCREGLGLGRQGKSFFQHMRVD